MPLVRAPKFGVRLNALTGGLTRFVVRIFPVWQHCALPYLPGTA
jgi:hypothetical protein